MKNKKFSFSLVFLTASLLLQAGKAIGQESKILNIGDQAPPLKYSKWIKGTPVKDLGGDKLYVLEFWATWCGPCKAAMPHLTQLQKEYADKAFFIGVNVWEKVPEDKPYTTSLPAVEKFVNGNDANMGYAVIADNNEQFMGKNWLKAAGENGIPSTFIVKNNQIIWIGHPNSLDSTLPKMLNGSFDMAAYQASFKRRADAGRAEAAAMTAKFKPIQDATNAKDYQKAAELIDKLGEEQRYKAMATQLKFGLLLNHVSQQQAIEYAREWQKESKSVPSLILGEVYNKDGFEKSTYLWAASNFEASNPSIENPIIFHALATCYAKGGDYKKAVTNEEKAVETAKKALKNGEMIGTIMDYTVVEYEKALELYTKQSKM